MSRRSRFRISSPPSTACQSCLARVRPPGARPGPLRLDPAPFEREAVGVEAEVGEQIEVLGIAMIVVACVAARLAARRRGRVLPRPPIVVPVAALDLVSGGGGAPEEPGWEAALSAR